MGGDPLTTAELLAQLTDAYGDDAVRRALSMTPVLSLTRDDAAFNLDTASRAARHPAAWGSLVMELPDRADEPVEVTWLSNTHVTMRPELRVMPKQKARRNAG